MLFIVIAGGIYRVTTAVIDTTKVTMENQISEEQLDTFLRTTRRAFTNLPATGSISLSYGAAGMPEIIFRGAYAPFGIPIFDGGEVVLTPRPQSDGTRTFSLLRIPPDSSSNDASRLRSTAIWFPLLRRVETVEWSILQGEEWVFEWEGSQRPELVRLRFYMPDTRQTIESIFRIPPASVPPRVDGHPQQPDDDNPQPTPPNEN